MRISDWRSDVCSSDLHSCGGTISEPTWHADPVFPHSSGGAHSVDNYLPAHAVCNNYRWDYTPDEYQLILKLGVWLKGEILRETSIGKQAAEKFVKKQASVAKRRRPSPSRPEAYNRSEEHTSELQSLIRIS